MMTIQTPNPIRDPKPPRRQLYVPVGLFTLLGLGLFFMICGGLSTGCYIYDPCTDVNSTEHTVVQYTEAADLTQFPLSCADLCIPFPEGTPEVCGQERPDARLDRCDIGQAEGGGGPRRVTCFYVATHQ